MQSPNHNFFILKHFILKPCKKSFGLYIENSFFPILQNILIFQQEILTTRQLQHPNILPYYTSFVNGLYLYIVTPLMNLGSCRDLINKYFNNGLPEQACCIILRDVLQGLDYIHRKGFIHR